MKIASLDIGTNTALLLIANINNNKINCKNKYSLSDTIKPLLNELRLPRLGKGLKPGGNISDTSLSLLYKYLEEYLCIIKEHNCQQVLAAGTNAFRIAANCNEIITHIRNRFDIDLEIIPGQKEAYLTYLGARSSARSPYVLLIDIGGGSTEITIGENDNILYSRSFQAGAVALSEKYIQGSIITEKETCLMRAEIENIFQPITNEIFSDSFLLNAACNSEAVAVAGTPVSLASIKMSLTDYYEEKIEGYKLNTNDIIEITEKLKHITPENILKLYGKVLEGREDIIVSGSFILQKILSMFNKNSVTVSTRGLRYGIIIDYLRKTEIQK